MSIFEICMLLLIAGLCGAIAKAISGVSRGGIIVSVALGFIGALLGSTLARALNLPEPFVLTVDSTSFPVIWSIIGAALFMALIRLLGGRRASE